MPKQLQRKSEAGFWVTFLSDPNYTVTSEIL